jgi:DNA modification methylase
MGITIHQGDTLDILPTLAPNSVQAIITSPPYFGLRDYGIPPSVWPEISYAPMAALPDVVIPEQTVCLGLEADPLAYVAHLVHVFRLARRVLRDDGVVCLNLGDSYAANRGYQVSQSKHPTLDYADSNASKVSAGLKEKDLLCIPHRVALVQADGWYLRMDVVWNKPNAMPESVKDRPTRAHEYVFILAKSARYFWDADAVREPHQQASIERVKYALNIGQGGDPAVLGKRSGNWKNDQINHPNGRNIRSVWSISTRPLADAHYAPMPETLAERCIRATTKQCDTVLDPFGGSGTTSRAAERLQRNAIHIEINPSYIAISERRTDGLQVEMFV